jgi:hypothetical protein
MRSQWHSSIGAKEETMPTTPAAAITGQHSLIDVFRIRPWRHVIATTDEQPVPESFAHLIQDLPGVNDAEPLAVLWPALMDSGDGGDGASPADDDPELLALKASDLAQLFARATNDDFAAGVDAFDVTKLGDAKPAYPSMASASTPASPSSTTRAPTLKLKLTVKQGDSSSTSSTAQSPRKKRKRE